ncbi:hypothetical protein K439DRAFT_1661040 [Ramaria rubella]|nr:hypothetical protein K439DRAFT_1661040 [Ramaria rubella]
MIPRKTPSLTRSIAYTTGALPPPAIARSSHKAKEQPKPDTAPAAHNPPNDPWAPIFDNISPAAPPVHTTPRPGLPPRFFTSRPAPKTFFSSNIPRSGGKRGYTTAAAPPLTAWDRIFEGVDDPPRAPSAFSSARRPKRGRPTMTAREISAFDKMFDMIFSAVSDKRRESFTTAAAQVQVQVQGSTTRGHSPPVPSESSSPADDTPSAEPYDLFGKLRRQSNRLRRGSAISEQLDRQKEEIELCETDQALLEWTVREVFQDEAPVSNSDSPPDSPPRPDSPTPEITRYLAHPTYPLLLAHVMRIFRTKYNDPHTALALFAHAKRRSIHSYVFGCTTPAYNELLATRWVLDGACVRGLRAVEEALVEMRANGVRPDKETRSFVERVRRDVGERFLGGEGASVEGDGEVWEMLERVEALVRKKGERGGGGGGGDGSGRDSRLDAKRRHWNEEWKTDNDGGKFEMKEDRLSLS